MSSRDEILQKITANKPASTRMPETIRYTTVYEDKLKQFTDTMAAIGGTAIRVQSYEQIIAVLEEKFGGISNKATTLPELAGWADFSLQIEDPHLLESVQVTVIRGHFGVAENAAVWVTEELLSHRALPFITQYLAIVIPEDSLVTNMHDAFEKIGKNSAGWGAFIAGPSKTADIEQSLVIGAHGPRGATVFLKS